MMIIKRQKNYSFLGFGKTKEININKEEFIKEFESYHGYNKQAVDEVKNHLRPGIKFPKSFETYLSFIFENYKEGTYRTGKDSIVLGYDEVINVLKKWEKSFGKSDKVILSQGKSEGFPKQIEYYAWWDRAHSIWLFVVSWGGFAQGLFGLGDSSQDPMTKLKWII